MAELRTEDLLNQEIFQTGTWNSDSYSTADLDAMVEAYSKVGFKPPLKLGHSDKQLYLEGEELPAAGWVENLRRSGNKLLADFKKVPGKIADLIRAGAFRRTSAEIYWDWSSNGQKHPRVLKAVALLGESIPAVNSLRDIMALYSTEFDDDGERPFKVYAFESVRDYIIRQQGSQWCVFSHDGSKQLGCYDTKGEAVTRLRQIEGHKNNDAEQHDNKAYPWDQCIADQKKKGLSDESAKKVCGFIKSKNASQDDSIAITDMWELAPECAQQMEDDGIASIKIHALEKVVPYHLPGTHDQMIHGTRPQPLQDCMDAKVKLGHTPTDAKASCLEYLKTKGITFSDDGETYDESNKDLYISRAQMQEVCAPCAEKMKQHNLSAIKLAWDEETQTYAMPGGMNPNAMQGLCKEFLPMDGFRTRCMPAMAKHVGDSGAYCNALKIACGKMSDSQDSKILFSFPGQKGRKGIAEGGSLPRAATGPTVYSINEDAAKNEQDVAQAFASQYWDKPRKVVNWSGHPNNTFQVEDGTQTFKVIFKPAPYQDQAGVYEVIRLESKHTKSGGRVMEDRDMQAKFDEMFVEKFEAEKEKLTAKIRGDIEKEYEYKIHKAREDGRAEILKQSEELEANIRKLESEKRSERIDHWIKTMKSEGKILPAEESKVRTLREYMTDEGPALKYYTIKNGKTEEHSSQPAELFESLFTSRTSHFFKELSRDEKPEDNYDNATYDNPGMEVDRRAKAYQEQQQEKNNKVSYKDACTYVMAKDGALAQRYSASQKQ